MIAFARERDRRIHSTERRFDMTVMSRLPRESRAAHSVIRALVLPGIIKGLVISGRIKLVNRVIKLFLSIPTEIDK